MHAFYWYDKNTIRWLCCNNPWMYIFSLSLSVCASNVFVRWLWILHVNIIKTSSRGWRLKSFLYTTSLVLERSVSVAEHLKTTAIHKWINKFDENEWQFCALVWLRKKRMNVECQENFVERLCCICLHELKNAIELTPCNHSFCK